MRKDNDIFAVSGASLIPGFLNFVDDLSPEKALLKFIGCPHPPNRPDLIKWSQETDNSYIRQQINLVENYLIKSQDKPENIDDDALMIIGLFTLESSIYKLLNGWCNLSNRSTNDLEPVSPYLKLLLQSLRRLPDKYRYKGIGVRVLDASIPVLKIAFDDYENHFAIGKTINFYSVSSWGKHEKLLSSFIQKGTTNPTIVLKCDRIIGYLIEELSMMPRLGYSNEGEVIVEGPSYFTVIKRPLQINNYIIVELEQNYEKSKHYPIYPFQKNIPYIVVLDL